jgi:hypothetical protein
MGLGAISLRAQEPPAHFPACTADSSARAFLARIRYLIATADSAERARLALGPVSSGEARLVIEEPLCLAASHAYARHSSRPGALAPPFPVVVVRAGDRYLVQLGGLSGPESGQWEVVIFDPVFQRVAGF